MVKKEQILTFAMCTGIAVSVTACGFANKVGMSSSHHMGQQFTPQPQDRSATSSASPLINNPAAVDPHRQQVEVLQQNNTMLQMQNRILTDVDSLRERVRRVERAMIRLDRRMKLVEKNELSRMSGMGVSQEMNQNSNMNGAGFKKMSASDRLNVANKQIDYGLVTSPLARSAPQTHYGAKFQPVSQVGRPMKSVLYAAPAAAPQNRMPKETTGNRSVLGAAMPSLADKPVPASEPNAGVTIWTVSYEGSKIWPSREQLLAAGQIIEKLKNGEKITIFARGVEPASPEFKDRVEAITGYFKQAASVDSVPIASMPAKHLGHNTIEFLAAN